MSQHQKADTPNVRTEENTTQTLIGIVWKTALTIVVSGVFAKLIGAF